MAEAFPLYWPEGWDRTKRRRPGPYKVTFGAALNDLRDELKRFNARYPVISANVPLRNDGLPKVSSVGDGTRFSGDPGVAVYFRRRDQEFVFACDKYLHPRDNMRAVFQTINALRTIERCGVTELTQRAFAGFKALPPPEKPKRPWWDVFGLRREDATIEVVQAVYKARSRKAHPDFAKDDGEAMKELNEALTEAKKDL